jgi:hypothetical protein
MRAADVIAAIGQHRFLWSSEDDLQAGIYAALRALGEIPLREVRLNARDRIDLVVDRVGIEVKITGSWRDVSRQLNRYLESDQLDDVVLVTPVAAHARIRAHDRLHVHILTRSGL